MPCPAPLHRPHTDAFLLSVTDNPPQFFMSSRYKTADCEPCPYPGGLRLSLSDSHRGASAKSRRCCCTFPQNVAVSSNSIHAPVLWAAWINTVRLFRTVNPRLRGFAPCKGEIPGVQNEVLCVGCISLSNAEGLGESLRPPRKLLPDTP